MQDIKLISATQKDIDTISRIAKLTWNQYYPDIISQQQINYMLEQMYSNESLEEQMLEKGHLFFLILLNDTTVGFISINRNDETDYFLNKFYIDQNLAAKGIGGRSFEELKKIIQPSKITLTVNRQNF